jgi:putative FmdB family regulatory protein
MPTYQYQCSHCGHEFEEFQKITDPPIKRCPQCGQKPQRVITGGAGFLLKGSGFYSTDYRSPSYKEAAKKEKEGDKSKSPPAEGKPAPDSKKPAAETEKKK